jgi:L-threonylcarbamoyladenylate synthase
LILHASTRKKKGMKDPREVAAIVSCLQSGGVIALPTETIYGLCCDPRHEIALERLFTIKQRSLSKNVICVTGSRKQIDTLALIPPAFEKIAARFWPGPLTVILPIRAKTTLSSHVIRTKNTILLRLSPDPLIKAITDALDFPIVASSANLSEHDFLRSAEDIRQQFGAQLDLIVETDHELLQIPSIVIECDSEGTLSLIRAGAIPWEEIDRCQKQG